MRRRLATLTVAGLLVGACGAPPSLARVTPAERVGVLSAVARREAADRRVSLWCFTSQDGVNPVDLQSVAPPPLDCGRLVGQYGCAPPEPCYRLLADRVERTTAGYSLRAWLTDNCQMTNRSDEVRYRVERQADSFVVVSRTPGGALFADGECATIPNKP